MAVISGRIPRSPFYFDPSALVRLDTPAQHSRELDESMPLLVGLNVSDLAIIEALSAFCRLRRKSKLTEADVDLLSSNLLADVDAHLFDKVHLNSAIHRASERRLIATSGTPLRAGDALHLELAFAVGCRTIVTFDRRLADAATGFGLHVFPVTESPRQTL